MGRHVRVSSTHPQAAAVCDRCGLWRNHVDLFRQCQWAGRQVVDTGFLVCRPCLDPLDPFDRARIIPPDGLPIRNPRPEPYANDAARTLVTEAGVTITIETGVPLIVDDVAP